MKRKQVITAYAEPAAGPGWGNSPIWVIYRDGNGKLTEDCIQPKDQTAEMAMLYRISASVHTAMVNAVKKRADRRKRIGA